MRAVRMALLEADVNSMSQGLYRPGQDKAMGEDVLAASLPGSRSQDFPRRTHRSPGGDNEPLNLEKPARILMSPQRRRENDLLRKTRRLAEEAGQSPAAHCLRIAAPGPISNSPRGRQIDVPFLHRPRTKKT